MATNISDDNMEGTTEQPSTPGTLQAFFDKAMLKTSSGSSLGEPKYQPGSIEEEAENIRKLRDEALEKLRNKITELIEYVKPQNNVHHDIKRTENLLKTLFHMFAILDEKSEAASATNPKRSTSAAITQTSPAHESAKGFAKRKSNESPQQDTKIE